MFAIILLGTITHLSIIIFGTHLSHPENILNQNPVEIFHMNFEYDRSLKYTAKEDQARTAKKEYTARTPRDGIIKSN